MVFSMLTWRQIRLWLKRVAMALAVLVAVVLAVVLARTWTFSSRQISVPTADQLAVTADDAAGRLARAVQIRTVSTDDAPPDKAAFAAMHALLGGFYPRVHRTLQREVVSEHSLLFTWPGSDPSLGPVLLAGHMDVVPVDPASASRWIQPPFSGAIADGFIWGRGTLDNKMTVMGVLEAVEALIGQGFTPRRTMYFAFGHDEEVGGIRGAKEIAALLTSRNINLDIVVDEGLPITEGVMDGVADPLAVVGVAEKGLLTIELVASTESGHSSVPLRETAISVLAAAVHRLQDNPMPGSVDGVLHDMLAFAGPEMPFSRRMVMANLWLFGPLVEFLLAGVPGTDAFLRTTTAATIFSAGNKDNVVPSVARSVVNFRLKPGDTIEAVLDHVRAVIDDSRIEITTLDGWEASKVTDPYSPSFRMVQRTIGQAIPRTVVVPGLVLGATDARHYESLADHVYRLSPTRLGPADVDRIHGVNERIAVHSYLEVVQFYAQLIRNLNSDPQ
ncbi:MAG: M20 family peptidase [Proteobacteria bacterium]|nr:M20 family peptidase [Pseudomonadota bacterium]